MGRSTSLCVRKGLKQWLEFYSEKGRRQKWIWMKIKQISFPHLYYKLYPKNARVL
jgi:hypothetical protein